MSRESIAIPSLRGLRQDDVAIALSIRSMRGCLPLAKVDHFVHHEDFKIAAIHCEYRTT